ncbi:hypothetical protein IT774_07500 [Salinimonas marina]|uniref:Uncharacterized protein n=1 Tax=Salinimonas marina TaxID=2785918 RepID=A0A7S9DZR9_9ALTE|nr:hypothetical protein [Salinimonas marina]QPG06939.1 hypothetical protein IT774_07500 [Salinimonas marina]
MTEYLCKAVIDGQQIEFETLGAVTLTQAIDQFDTYLSMEHHLVMALSAKCEFTRISI